ncbi:single-stranded DNA-binding protein, partial [Candidatus Margulisiibacteriota bacterium]
MPKIEEELLKLLEVLPPRVKQALLKRPDVNTLLEVVLDLGKSPEARFDKEVCYIPGELVSHQDLDFVLGQVSEFSGDNRAGIERTLHRISCIRNRRSKIIGLTCRVGRSILGTIDIVRDAIESGKNTLFMGPPGIG